MMYQADEASFERHVAAVPRSACVIEDLLPQGAEVFAQGVVVYFVQLLGHGNVGVVELPLAFQQNFFGLLLLADIVEISWKSMWDKRL
jgi:hypothetical protein